MSWAMQQRRDKERAAAAEATRSGTDPVDVLARQILAQGTSGNWSGEGFGGAEQNAREMAKMFAGIGITDINQFGKIKTLAPDTGGPANAAVYQNDPNDPSKGYYTFEHMRVAGAGEDGGEGIVATKNKIPVDPKNISQQQQMVLNEAEGRYDLIPFLSTTTPVYEETFGNKVTNQPLVDPNRYDRRGGNIFSGTYAGKNQTQFGVQFRDDGTPVFYTQEGPSTSNVGEIMQIASLAMSLFAPGIGGAIGSALTGTAATTVISKVVGAAIVQGTMAELSGGDFKKGAIAGAVGAGVAPLVSNTIGSAVAEAMGDSAFNKVVTNAVTSASTAALTAGLTGNGDVGEAALSAAVGSVGGTVGKELGGDTGAKIGTALGKIASGADTEQVLTSTIMDTLTSTVKAALKDEKNKNDLSKASSKEVGQGEVDAIKQYLDSTGTPPPSMAEVTTPGADTLQNLLDSSSGTQLASSDNDAALSAIEDLRKPAEAKEDPLLGLSSAEVGQGEIDAITGADAATGTGSVVEGDYNDLPTNTEEDPLLGLSSAEAGQGEKDAIDYDALLGLSSAEVGQGEKDAIDTALSTAPVTTKPVTTAPVTTAPVTTAPVTKAADAPSGFDLGSLLALMGGEQKPAKKPEEVTNEPFVAFDFNSPFRVNPFAPNPPTPRMAEGGSIDELLEMLQYRG